MGSDLLISKCKCDFGKINRIFVVFGTVSMQVLYNIHGTEDMLGINIYVKEVRYCNQFGNFISVKKPLLT